MFKLFFDEDSLNRAVISGAQRLGFDCSSVGEERRWGRSDGDQLSFAAASGRAIFTCNVGHFAALHWDWIDAGRTHCGIIALTDQDMPPGVQIRALERMASELSDEALFDSLVYLTYFARKE